MSFDPTDEQQFAVDLAVKGNDITVEALAGAGKTSTLRLIADALPGRGKYVAFNRKIVDDSREGFERRGVTAKTAHQLAWAACGKRFSHQPLKQRLKSKDVAEVLGVDLPWVYDREENTIELHPPAIGGLAMDTVEAFGRSADDIIGRRHVPLVRSIDPDGEFHNNRNLAERIVPLARKIWEDMKRPHDGHFVMGFNYLKLWQLSDPVIDGDYILFDEAQDANPVMLSIVQRQDHMQRIYVGDSRQQIYEWNGAVNALANTGGDRCFLTRSFRFGPEIAEAANRVLARLSTDESIEVIGAGPEGRVGSIEGIPDVYLARTNAGVVLEAISLLDRGYRVCVQGGTWEVVKFALAAERLMNGQDPDHDDLRGFKTWEQVVEYVEKDSLGSDLKLMVTLVERFGPRAIIDGLSRVVKVDKNGKPVGPVDVFVSTAHKSKGAEWGRVKLVADFMEPEGGEEIPDPELRLLYVAVTRAQNELDPGFVSLSGRPSLDALRAAMAATLEPDEVPVDTLAAGQLSLVQEATVANAKGHGDDELEFVDDRTREIVRKLSDRAGVPACFVANPGIKADHMAAVDRQISQIFKRRERQPRELSIDAARDRLGRKCLDASCDFCKAEPGKPCTIQRGRRAGLRLAKAHTPRVEAAAKLHDLRIVEASR